MKGQQRKKRKKRRRRRKRVFWITAVWRPLTQMCRWSWPQWRPGAGHSSLWWFSAGMRAAGTGFCSVAAKTADCVFIVEVSVAFKALIVSSSFRFPLIVWGFRCFWGSDWLKLLKLLAGQTYEFPVETRFALFLRFWLAEAAELIYSSDFHSLPGWN